MKTKSERLEPVKKVAQQKEFNEAGQLAKIQQAYAEAQVKLHELVNYRLEYVADFNHKAKKGISGSQLMHYKNFMLQMDRAIETQQQQIIRLQSDVQSQRKVWQSSNIRSRTMVEFQKKVRTEERVNRDKKESRQAEDEFNQLRS